MASKIYQSDVYTAPGCCGEYVEVTRRNGRIVARTVKLFTHDLMMRSPWEPATVEDIDRAHAPLAWRDEAASTSSDW